MRDRPRVVSGLVLVAVGVVLLLHELDVVDAGELLARWWPLVVVGAGVLKLLVPPRSTVSGVLLVVVGGVLLAWRLGLLDDPGLLWPVLLLLAGGWLLLGRRGAASAIGDDRVDPTDGHVDTVTVFGDRRVHVRPGVFRGGSAVTVFGDVDIDLSRTELTGVAKLGGLTLFGDVDILVPPGWQVSTVGLTLFGDVDVGEPVGAPAVGAEASELRIDILTVFGDVAVQRAWPRRP